MRRRLTLPPRRPRGAWWFWLPANPAFGLLSCPLSPKPPSPVGKGVPFTLFRRGLRPRHPGIRPLAALTVPAKQVPRAEGSPRFASKPIEPPFYWQCRQPRRGGTGGEELRRLRWSSPPGRGEQVPQGEQPPSGHLLGRDCKCRRRSNAGDARGKAPCIRKQ